jgi:hypothetical protein
MIKLNEKSSMIITISSCTNIYEVIQFTKIFPLHPLNGQFKGLYTARKAKLMVEILTIRTVITKT